MAEYIVDEFKVKRSGFLSAWRGVRIYVSDGGVIRLENTTNSTINLDRISDYSSNDRRYSPGQVITSFCNFTTFTKYTVTAIDERPFVVVTDELNATSCGFETPLPQPFIPFNPFGLPNYAPFRTFSFCDYQDETVDVLIEKKDYVGDSLSIQAGTNAPVVIRYPEVESKFATYRPMQFDLNFIESNDFELEQFYSEDERTFRVTVSKQGIVKAKGYIIPDTCREEFKTGNKIISLKCTDAIQSLKSASFPIPLGTTFDLSQSFIGVLCYALSPTNLNLDIATICNYYSINMPNSLNDDPLDLATINPLRLTNDKGGILTCFEVLDEVCKAWGMFLVQSDGVWNFVRTNELSQEIIRQRVYDYTGFRKVAQNVFKKRLIGAPL